jgi:hypothetical protein
VSLKLHVILQNIFLIDIKERIVTFLFADSPLESDQLSEGTRETSQNKQDNSKSEVCLQGNESVSTEDNDDEFHSLESSNLIVDSASHSIVDSADVQGECPLKKLQVGNADNGKEETISTQVQSVEGKELLTPSQPTTRNTESNPQNLVSDQQPIATDTFERRHLVEEQGSNLEAVGGLSQKIAEPVDVPEADIEENKQSVTAEGKHS